MKGIAVGINGIAVALAMVIAGSALAAEKKTIPLMGQKDSPKASGTAVVEGNQLKVTAKGLKPNAIYTVWLSTCSRL
jgi:hypothetical protein